MPMGGFTQTLQTINVHNQKISYRQGVLVHVVVFFQTKRVANIR